MHISFDMLTKIIEEGERLERFKGSIKRNVADNLPNAGVEALLDFLDVPTGSAFDVPEEQAIAYFRAKGLKTSFSWADFTAESHDQAFTVAKMMDVDLLGHVRASLDDALANGVPFKQWADELIPTLQKAGWWGKATMVDPLLGLPQEAQLGSPWRLETIFRTNMQTAYAAGQWREIEANKDIAPYLMYDAVDDFRTRAAHKSWDRTILPVDHAFWRTHYPPCGFNCRCGVIQLSGDEIKAMGLTIDTKPKGDNGFYSWTNPRTGKRSSVPDGVDPGFNHNSGLTLTTDLKKLLGEKVAVLPPSLRKSAVKSIEKADDAAEAAKRAAALAEVKEIQDAQAALERSKRTLAASLAADADGELLKIKNGERGAVLKRAYELLISLGVMEGLPIERQLTTITKMSAELLKSNDK